LSASREAGKRGEKFAEGLLRQHGCRILATNYHSRFGEVDIIAREEAFLLFVEVKTRRRGSVVSGVDAVTPAKQRKIIATALQYLQEHPHEDLQPRFDVISIETGQRGEILDHEYLMGAFDGEFWEKL